MIDPTTRISRNPDVVFRSLQDEQGGVLLHLQSGAYHGLNDVAAVIWRAIENETWFADVVAAFALRSTMRRTRSTRTCPGSSRT